MWYFVFFLGVSVVVISGVGLVYEFASYGTFGVLLSARRIAHLWLFVLWGFSIGFGIIACAAKMDWGEEEGK